jgi:hypothetical protein
VIRVLVLGAVTALLGGCGEPQLLTVDKYLAQCEALKGKPVRLAGYLGECAGYDCHLAASKAAWASYVDAFTKGRSIAFGADPKASPAALKEASAAWDKVQAVPMIGVGGDEAFDNKAAPFQHRYVVITAQVAKDTCTGAGGTDRSAGIEPTNIRAWTSSEGAPANTN